MTAGCVTAADAVLQLILSKSAATGLGAVHRGDVLSPVGVRHNRVSPVRICTRKLAARRAARVRVREAGVSRGWFGW
jgi:hypothetical protein